MLPNHPKGVIILGREYLKELFEAPETDLNFLEATLEHTDFRNTFKGNIYDDWHASVIRNELTQNIPALMPDMVDEAYAVFEDELESAITKGKVIEEIAECRLDSYRSVPKSFEYSRENERARLCGSPRVYHIVLLAYLMKGRNPEYLAASVDHAFSIAMAGQLLTLVPWFLKPYSRRPGPL
jgi:hypothetical protein